jgi:hypothetical protein
MSTTITNVKERPILFSAPMVRAILAGEKTQTRREVKGLGVFVDTEMDMGPPTLEDVGWIWPDGTTARCPYGKPGDQLWVREKWRPTVNISKSESSIYYAADGVSKVDKRAGVLWRMATASRWRPSIHMPRWASRLTLEVTGVRVQRLDDTGEDDARAEGVVDTFAFEELWDSINGKGAWAANPWVWVVSFNRVESSR